MKTRKYKIPTWFIEQELCHKISIGYEGETKRSIEILDELFAKYLKIDRRRKYNWIEVTEEEYQTWYVYFLEYYIDPDSWYYKTKEEAESKKLLSRMRRFFGEYTFDESHRAGAKIRFVTELVKAGLGASSVTNLKTKH